MGAYDKFLDAKRWFTKQSQNPEKSKKERDRYKWILETYYTKHYEDLAKSEDM